MKDIIYHNDRRDPILMKIYPLDMWFDKRDETIHGDIHRGCVDIADTIRIINSFLGIWTGG